MNLLFCTARFHPHIGGAESMLDDLTRTLAAHGESVSVLTSRISPDLSTREHRDGVEITRAPYPPTEIRSPLTLVRIVVSAFRVWWAMGTILRARHIDVACVGVVGVDLIPLLVWRRLRRFRVVVYLHGGELRSYIKVSRAMRWALGRALRSCDAVVAVSEALAREAVRFEPSVGQRVVVIPNAVDVAAIRATPAHRQLRPYALFAGRLHPVKDLDTLVAAFHRVAQEIPQLDLIIAGEGPLDRSLRQRVEQLGLSARVQFPGPQSRREVAALLAGCEFAVLPSLAEGCPMFVLEAQAAGRLLIGSRVKGIADVVDDHLTGELFEAGDVSGLATLMAEASDPSHRQAIEARVREAPPLDIGSVWARHLSAYRGDSRPLSIAVISCFFGHDPSNSGLSSYYLTLCRSLVALGHDVHLVTTPESVVYAKADGIPALTTHTTQRALLPKSADRTVTGGVGRVAARLRFAWEAWRTIRRLDRSEGVDVVIAPELFAPGLFVALAMRHKLVTRVHTPTVFGDGHNLASGVPWISRVIAWPERLQAMRSQACSAASRHLIDAVADEWRVPSSRIALVPNSISIEATQALADLQAREIEGAYVLYVGRLEARKGVHVLTDALRDVLPRHPAVTAVYVGADWGLKATILDSEAYSSGRLMLLDTMERPRLFGLIRHARLVVLPSLFENVSNAALESMALARPVIGTHRTAFAELIDHGVTGFLVEPGDRGSLAMTLNDALDRSDLEAIGARARERVRQFDALAVGRAQVAFLRAAVFR